LITQTLAVVRREWQVQRRYPISMLNTVVFTPIYQLALPTLLLGSAFVVSGHSLGLAREAGTPDLAAWMTTGVLLASITVGAVTSVYNTLHADRTTGVMEHSWSTPASRHTYVVGAVLTGTLFGGGAAVLIGAMALLLGARFDPAGLLLSIPAMAVVVVGNCGFGYLVAATLLLLRQASVLVEVTVMAAVLFSGVTFPLTLLPGATRWPTYVLPGTWGLDLTRVATLGTPPLLPLAVEITLLLVTSAVLAGVGYLTFSAAERALARAGTLSQF
jgi:ABC-type polysaccharide/polyol phosphate export permease